MGCCNIVTSLMLVCFSFAVVLTITCIAGGECTSPKEWFSKLGAAGKNRLAGFLVLLVGAATVGLLKWWCAVPETQAWSEALITLVTGFVSAVAAVFINPGFPGFKDPTGHEEIKKPEGETGK